MLAEVLGTLPWKPGDSQALQQAQSQASGEKLYAPAIKKAEAITGAERAPGKLITPTYQ